MITQTKSTNPIKLLAASSTAASITNPTPTTTEPSGDGVFDLRSAGAASEVFNFAELLFFGAGSDNAAGHAAVVLWTNISGLWIPSVVLNLDLTLSSATGVAGAVVTNTDRFVDTIAVTADTVNSTSVDVFSPANNTPSKVIIDLQGSQKVQVLLNKGTATNLNTLMRGF